MTSDKYTHDDIALFSHLFVTMGQTMMRNLERQDVGLTPLQDIALFAVYTHPGLTMTNLAEHLGIARAQMTRLISGMEHAGLVKRKHNPDNRREVWVMRTAYGDEIVEEHMQQVENAIQARLGDLSAEDRSLLAEHLRASINILAKADIVPAPGHNHVETQ